MCAIEAGRRRRRVLVLDHANKAGKKILISGGGRCNFTNLYATPDSYQSQNKPFCVSALTRYTPQDFIALVEKHHISYHEKKLGQLFCNGSATEIVQMLLDEAEAANVTVRLQCKVTTIRRTDEFLIETNLGSVAAGSLTVATGGLSIPLMGATGFAYAVARQVGPNVVRTRPVPVPYTSRGQALAFCRCLGLVRFSFSLGCFGPGLIGFIFWLRLLCRPGGGLGLVCRCRGRGLRFRILSPFGFWRLRYRPRHLAPRRHARGLGG